MKKLISVLNILFIFTSSAVYAELVSLKNPQMKNSHVKGSFFLEEKNSKSSVLNEQERLNSSFYSEITGDKLDSFDNILEKDSGAGPFDNTIKNLNPISFSGVSFKRPAKNVELKTPTENNINFNVLPVADKKTNVSIDLTKEQPEFKLSTPQTMNRD
ncbi:MAG: hypothetical protein ACQEQS_06440 [Thermodesulfobacteriota bacterium]